MTGLACDDWERQIGISKVTMRVASDGEMLLMGRNDAWVQEP